MYAVVVRGQAQDGKMEDLKNFIKNEAIPSLEVEGMISIGFCNPEENVNLGMVFLTDKEAADRFGEARNENIAKLQDILAGPPNVVEGEITLGKVYQDRSANDNQMEEAYVRVVFAKVENSEVPTNFVKEKIFPIYEEAEGLRAAGFFVVDGEAVSWNIWDSEEAANVVVPKFNEELTHAEGVFLEEPHAYMGNLYAGKNFIDITKSK